MVVPGLGWVSWSRETIREYWFLGELKKVVKISCGSGREILRFTYMMMRCLVTRVTGGQDWANRLKRPTVLNVGRILFLNHPKQRNSPIQITLHPLNKVTSYYYYYFFLYI